MKKLVLTLTATLACVAAFAQGKVTFISDANHLTYFTTDTAKLLTADVGQAGVAVAPTGVTLSGETLAADLWYGTSSSSLALIKTATMVSATPGTIPSTAVLLPDTATYYFQVQVYNQADGSAAAAKLAGHYYGYSDVFTGKGGSFAANPIIGSAFTWAAGTQTVAFGNGVSGTGLGAIALQANVPEPTSLALLGLGAAGMLIFRRRK